MALAEGLGQTMSLDDDFAKDVRDNGWALAYRFPSQKPTPSPNTPNPMGQAGLPMR